MANLDNVIKNKLHPITGEDLKPTLAPTWRDGSAMTDARCGGLYNRDSTLSGIKYFKWNGAGAWPVSRLTVVNQSNFQKLINDYGDNPATIFIDKTVNLTTDMIIPENVSISAGCLNPFNVGVGVTLTILSAINEGSRRLFSGTGTVKLTYASRINICWFGARGDSNGNANNGTESGVAINKAIETANFTGARVFVPDGVFRTDYSINMTKSDPNASPIILEGISTSRSKILGDLKEVYPVIDACNNKRGGISSLIVDTTTSSLDSCSVFLSETAATGVNLFEFNDAIIRNSSPNAKLSVAAWCADQLKFNRSETISQGASCIRSFYAGKDNIFNIQSKFKAPAQFTGDLTYISSMNSQYTCTGTEGQENFVVELEEYSLVSFTKDYFALKGQNSTGSIISLKSGTRNMQPIFRDCRSEGGVSAGDVNVFKIVDYVYNGEFTGSYITRTLGGVFTGPGTMRNCRFAGSNYPKMFRDAGPLQNCIFDIHAGSNVLGTLTSDGLSGSYNNEFAGRVGDLENILSGTVSGAASGSTPLGTMSGLKLRSVGNSNNTRFDSTTDGILLPSISSPVNLRKTFAGESGSIAIGAYTGGSGLVQIASFVIPVAVFTYPNKPEASKVFPFLDVEIMGDTSSGFAASGSLVVTISQDGVTTTLATLTNIPGGQNGFKSVTRLFANNQTATSIIAFTDLDSAPTASGARRSTSRYFNLSPYISKSGGPLTIGLSVNNASDNPIAHLYRTIKG